jgi:WD40 repeat protein/serine/threonine protein kinase
MTMPEDQTIDSSGVAQQSGLAEGTLVSPPGYELREEIGRGGMGAVYRALDVALGRDVAVKLLSDRFAPDSSFAQRFLSEARITGQLQHPGIPAVHQVGNLPDGRPFLAMKLIKGSTLEVLLTERADPSAERGRLLGVFEAVCQAVGYAHAHQVIHRDLKPSNIMVGAFGEVQVMDWGLAKVLGASAAPAAPMTAPDETRAWTEVSPLPQSDGSYTQAGALVGTPAFIPPEQAGGELEKIDQRADVFGLGALLTVILTGKPPYVAATVEAVRLMAVRGQLEDCLCRLDRCAADPELVALCKRCLAFNPADRPSNAGEVASVVASYLSAAEDRARRAELDRVRSEEQGKRRRVQFILAATVAGLVAVAGFGAAVVTLWQRAEKARGTAELAHDSEKTARHEAELARARFECLNYGRTIEVAYEHWRDGNVAAARLLLDGTRPTLRGWEYYYVHRLCHADLLTLRGHTDMVMRASFSADGLRIVTASLDRTAKVWNAATGTVLLTLKGHTDRLYSASFSPDGSRIVTGSADQTAKVWDAHTGELLLTLKGHTAPVQVAAFNDDGRIVTASADHTAKLWDAHTGAALVTFRGHSKDIRSMSFCKVGPRIVTGSMDRTAKVWNAKTGAELLSLKHTGSVEAVSFRGDGSRIVTADVQAVKVWDAHTGAELMSLRHAMPQAASFSEDGSRIVTGSVDGTAKIWDAHSGAELLTLKGHTRNIRSASFDASGFWVVTASLDGTARVWDARAQPEGFALGGHSSAVVSASFSRDGSRIVTVSFGTIKVRDTKNWADLLTIKGHTTGLFSASFSADGSRIVTGCDDDLAKAWDARTGTKLLDLKGHTNWIRSASFGRNDSRILTASVDRTAKVWDASTGAELVTLKGHTNSVISASFNGDGSRIVTGSTDRTARVWDAQTGAELLVLRGHTAAVWPASFSSDGTRILTASWDNTARVWDASTGAELFTLKGHTEPVMSAAFSPDGSRIVTGSRDRTVKVWDAQTGAELLSLKGHTSDVLSISFSADGSCIVTAALNDRTARVWDARPLNRQFATSQSGGPTRAGVRESRGP